MAGRRFCGRDLVTLRRRSPKKAYPGLFVTFEGPEGSGKSTQLAALADFLEAQGVPVVRTREPGGTPIGEQVRRILLDHANQGMHPRTEVLLFQASRAEHVTKRIAPALEQGQVVLCDRYADSTLAYQGYGRQTDLAALAQVVAYATGGVMPDLTLLLDLPVEEGLRRRRPLLQEWNRLDAETLAFHRRVRQGYLRLAAQEPARWVTIDARRSMDAVQAEVRRVVVARLRQKGLWPEG